MFFPPHHSRPQESIISIHLSGKLSGTVQSAKTAKTITDYRDIYVIDSKTASMGLGLIVLAAAKEAYEGRSVRDVLSTVNDKIEKSFVVFLVDTLEYLEKGGRIGKAGNVLGTLLKIKPILTIEDGQVVPLEKVRGEIKAIEQMTRCISERTDNTRWYNCAFVYGNRYKSLNRLREKVLDVIKCEDPLTTEIGAVIMSHVGPELIGVAICPD
jgi:DegV family protein with EDD domain